MLRFWIDYLRMTHTQRHIYRAERSRLAFQRRIGSLRRNNN